MTSWTAVDIPNQAGKIALVTGANSGIGFHTALELARAGARVVLTARDQAKGEAAIGRIRLKVPEADVALGLLDLADLGSVHRLAADVIDRYGPVDLLVNNAGVMAVPERRTTTDGFELQLGTNHLGPFALTGLLLPALLARPGARVVSVSSINHRWGQIRFDDLQSARRYGPWRAYNQSKLANLLFAFELDRRVQAQGLELVSVAAHPGDSSTNLQSAGPRLGRFSLGARALAALARPLAQAPDRGALPSLYAATAPGVVGGGYYGPDGLGQTRGFPVRVRPARKALDAGVARRLWEVSEELTGVTFDWAPSPLGQAVRIG